MSTNEYKVNLDKLKAIAQTMSKAPIVVTHAYQAYQLVKEQGNGMLWITDADIANICIECWPHLFDV